VWLDYKSADEPPVLFTSNSAGRCGAQSRRRRFQGVKAFALSGADRPSYLLWEVDFQVAEAVAS